MLCEKHTHDPGSKELTIENPRVVNGSQTLHIVRDVSNPSANARVMVRIIEIPFTGGDDVSAQAVRKREIVNKISVRSNQQNPTKRWTLVANDDFQVSVYRYFRTKGLFYERREKGWNYRSRELRSTGIRKGPTLKFLAQLIAAFYWDNGRLGPANARSNVAELFDSQSYEIIRATPLETVYQIYLLDALIYMTVRDLALTRRYIESFRGYADFVLLSLLARTLQNRGGLFQKAEFTTTLEAIYDDWAEHERAWRKLLKESIDHVRAIYRKRSKAFKKSEGRDLTVANFFKSAGHIRAIFSKPVPAKIRSLTRVAIP